MKHLLRCVSCNSYTLKDVCSKCNSPAVTPKPPRFSLEDKFGYLRRKAKRIALEKGCLL